ncbi:MAG: S8 family serine peptidase [Bryobacteraceae bacterium]|nr:S8 family serine peptidase [Bryobacteraceae bacterium]
MYRLLFACLLTYSAVAQNIVPGRFIVEMEDAGKGSRAALTSRELGAEVIGQSEHAIVVRDADETKLRQVPGVKAVHPVIEGIFLLDRALSRSNFPAAWNLSGGQANGGRGMKIAIMDSGIEASHPAFQTSDLTIPDGYPKVRAEADRALTGNKIIVIRNYQDLQGVRTPSAADRDGHGTSTAGTAAGVMQNAPQGAISGAAPGAQLGIYKIGPTATGNVWTSDALVLAIDDAVADGMDVINMSIGYAYSTPTGMSPITAAIERAEKAGVIVIGAAGNSGPDPNTIGSVSTTSAMLQVGALWNDRLFSAAARVEGAGPLLGLAGDRAMDADGVSGPLLDTATLNNAEGCSAYAPRALAGRVAFIVRGVCTFEEKLNRAAAAGAVGALLYNNNATEGAIRMSMGQATLPGLMLSNQDGLALKARLRDNAAPGTQLDFRVSPVIVDANRLAGFSSRGPAADLMVRPDVSAVGKDVYLPTQSTFATGEIYSANGYTMLNGTSFSAPITAGAAAVLKSLRPGLTAAQYRSLLVNTADTVERNGRVIRPQEGGAGLVNVGAAAVAVTTANPVSLTFSASSGTVDVSRILTFDNLAGEPDRLTFSVQALDGNVQPQVPAALDLPARGRAAINVAFSGTGIAPGPYQGWLIALSERTGQAIRVPYWHGVGSDTPAALTPLLADDSARVGARLQFVVQVTDSAGLFTNGVKPTVTAVTRGGVAGRVVTVAPVDTGFYVVTVTLALGTNAFDIEAGDLRTTVLLTGQ